MKTPNFVQLPLQLREADDLILDSEPYVDVASGNIWENFFKKRSFN
jgi:hypothetical protein